jgi:hypothetical protein
MDIADCGFKNSQFRGKECKLKMVQLAIYARAPLTRMFWPEIQRASSLTRKAITSAMSSGSPNVRLHREGLASLRLNRCYNLLSLLCFGGVVNNDRSALFGQPLSNGPANASRRTRYQSNLFMQHFQFLIFPLE